MKIDKGNPVHWLFLLLMGANVLVAILLRPLLHRRRTGRVLLYGHKRSGNLLAIHDWVLANRPDGMDVRYLSMDPGHYAELRRQGVPCVLAISPAAIGWLATADAIVSDHGLHALRFMLGMSDMKFFDVWHGIPFKGFDASDFRVQHRYNEVWVPSPLLASLYVEKFGFDRRRLAVTGYARTDRLSMGKDVADSGAARRRLGLPEGGKIVLFAPTWKQDDRARSIFPFGAAADAFCDSLSQVAARHGATIALRTHLNSGTTGSPFGVSSNIKVLPVAKYPDTENILLASDILICDWSSIAFDFLLLDRPTIFLDVDPPFAKGLSLDASYRFGAIASDMNSMLAYLDRYLANPSLYHQEFCDKASETRRIVYDDFSDGKSAERCFLRLQAAVHAPR